MRINRILNGVAAVAGIVALTGSAMGNPLVLTTDNEQQQIEIIVGPQAGRVKVIGIDGIPSGQVFNGVTLIDLRTGTNLDAIEFRMFGTVFPEVRVNTQSGPSDVKFIYDVRSANRVTTLVSVLGGSSPDKVAFEVLNNDATNLAATWTVNHFAGDNETLAAITSDDATRSIALNLSSDSAGGIDKVTTSLIHRAQFVTANVVANTRAGNDSVVTTIDGLGAAITNLTTNADLGQGGDTLETLVISRGGQASLWGTVRGGGGGDLLKVLFEGNGRMNQSLTAEGGDDYLDVELKGAITGTPRLFAGDGEDFLKIVQESRQANPVLNGGSGIDTGQGWGTIISVENRD